jgi:hypothetical protein
MSDERQADEPAHDELGELLGSIEIVIGPDGEVVFTDLDPALLEVALSLDPDSDLACRRPTVPDSD